MYKEVCFVQIVKDISVFETKGTLVKSQIFKTEKGRILHVLQISICWLKLDYSLMIN